jgi:hypothetical protein
MGYITNITKESNMKVGDLVKHADDRFHRDHSFGVVIGIPDEQSPNHNILVLWSDGATRIHTTDYYLEVV